MGEMYWVVSGGWWVSADASTQNPLPSTHNRFRSLRLRSGKMFGPSQPLQYLRRPLPPQLIRQPHAAQLRLVDVEDDGAAHDACVGDVGDQAVQERAMLGGHGEGSDRHLTAPFQRLQERPFGAHGA